MLRFDPPAWRPTEVAAAPAASSLAAAAVQGADATPPVLVLAPFGRDADSACALLRAEGLQARACSSLAALAAGIDATTGALLVTSEGLAGRDLAPLVAALEAQPPWSDLPLICLTLARTRQLVHGEAAHAQLARRVGNMLVLERPLSRESLVSVVRSALKNRGRQFRLRDEIEQLRRSRAEVAGAQARREFLFQLVRSQRELASPALIMQRAAEALRRRLQADRVSFYSVREAAGPHGGVLVFGPGSVGSALPALQGERAPGSATPGLSVAFHRAGRWAGGLHVDHVAPRDWSTEERALVEEAAQLCWDAVERSRSAEALRDSELQRARAEERDRVWRLSRELLAIADADDRWHSVNPAWQALLGWPQQRLVGQPLARLLHPQDRPGMRQALQRLRAGQPVGTLEGRLRARDGSHRTLSWTAVLVDGRVHLAGRDITEQRAQALALQQAGEQLRHAQKMEALGQLTGGIAHDFNNLLQGITGALAVVRKKLALGSTGDLDRFLDSATRSAMRAAGLTHRLLAFSRRQPLAPTRVETRQLVLSMTDLLRQTLGEGVTLRFALAPDVPAVACDQNQLENAILNLAINARDAMPHGGELTVITRAAEAHELDAAAGDDARYVAIAVRDSGVGMSTDTAARAFEPFFTTKPTGQGTGLGLSMIYGFAQQSKGACRIDSAPARGTTVTLYLPQADAALPAPAPPRSVAVPGAVAQGRVLVVEDDDEVRAQVVAVLRQLGLVVLHAADGSTGLAVLQSDTPLDALVTDVGLPGLNGRQLADAARVDRPGLPVLFMTGYADTALTGEGQLQPGMQLLTKPFDLDVLAARVRAMLPAG